jgi:hypothetical protein
VVLLLQGSMPLPAVGAADLLQLAMNGRSFALILAALNSIPVQLDAPTMCRLLLTAAVRCDGLVCADGQFLQRLAKAPAVQQHIDAPTLSAVLDLLFPLASHEAWWRYEMALKLCLRLLEQAVGQEMGGDAVEVPPVYRLEARFGRPLFHAANVQQLGVEVMLKLLGAAVGKFFLDLDVEDLQMVGYYY